MSPVSGEVVAVNSGLSDDSSKVRTDSWRTAGGLGRRSAVLSIVAGRLLMGDAWSACPVRQCVEPKAALWREAPAGACCAIPAIPPAKPAHTPTPGPATPPFPCPQVNTDPFGEGWMIKVKLSNKGELDELMDSAAYSSFCESGGH